MHIEAIVYKQSDYRDNDLIVHCITKDNSLVSLILTGAKKPNSKTINYGMLGNTYDYEIAYHDHKSIYRYRSGSLVKARNHLLCDLKTIALCNCILELVDKTINNNHDIDIYDDLKRALDLLNNKEDGYLILALFITKVLGVLGINPYVDGCVICQDTKVVGLSVEDGGFVCKNHLKYEHLFKKDRQKLQKFRYLQKASFVNFDILKELIIVDKEDIDILLRFLNLHGQIKINSYHFLENIE